MSGHSQIKCPNGHELKIDASVKPGRRLGCPKCGARFRVTKHESAPKQPEEEMLNPNFVNPYALDNVLLVLGNGDVVTLRDLLQNVLAIGRTGSGKSSSVVPLILGALFKPEDQGGPHAGGFLFCVKNDDAENYRRIIKQCGRSEDIVEISLDSGHVFNPLLFEQQAVGEQDAPNAIVELFDSITRLLDRGRKEGGGDSHWRFASKRLLRLAVEALQLARIPLTLPNIERLVTSVPHLDHGELDENSAFWESSFCIHVLDRIELRLHDGELSQEELNTFERLGQFFIGEMAKDDQRHKMSVISTLTSVCASLTSGRFLSLFNGEKNTVNLEDTFLKGTIFIVNIPIQQHHEVARMGSGVLRRCSMRSMERRVIDDIETARAVVFCADEYAQLADGEYDQIFTSASRSKKCVTFNLCQSIDQIYDAMGSKERAHSLLANMKWKLFLANDGETAEYASKLIGKRWTTLGSSGTSFGGAGQGYGAAQEAQVEYKITADFFALKSGGPPGFTVDVVLFNGGEPFSTGAPFLDISISQNLLGGSES